MSVGTWQTDDLGFDRVTGAMPALAAFPLGMTGLSFGHLICPVVAGVFP